MPHREDELWALRDRIVKEFTERDRKWQSRRDIRFRRMDRSLKAMPLNPRIADKALMVYQTEAPNQEVHKRVKRLIANRSRFEVVVFDDDPRIQRLGQDLENGVTALYKWMSRKTPDFEQKITQHQQGDGVGIGKIDFLPDHGSSLADLDLDVLDQDDEDDGDDEVDEGERASRTRRNRTRAAFRQAVGKFKPDDPSRFEKAYDVVVQGALRQELPPFRISAPDPLACYWWEDGDGVAIMVETGKKSLSPLLSAFKDYGLKLVNNRLVVEDDLGDALGAMTVPDTNMPKDLSEEVSYTEMRTRDRIYIMIDHPTVRERARGSSRGRGIILDFHNPFGPYTTGYELAAGDVTTSSNREDEYQPPVLGTLNSSHPLNVLMTARLSAALDQAFAPPYMEVKPDQQVSSADEDKTPEVQEGRDIPVIPGQLRRLEGPNVELDKADARLLGDISEFKVQDALLGEATSDASGHRLAIQVSQADIQMVPYQNARSDAITKLMKGIIYAVRRHGLTVYIPTLPNSRRIGKQIRVSPPASITPEMADINFELVVSLGSETAVTKYGKWQSLAQREEQGTIGYMTVIEESDVDDPMDELNRIVEGKALKALIEQLVPQLAQMVFQRVQEKFTQATNPLPEPEIQAEAQEIMSGQPPAATGLAEGGGGGVGAEDLVRLPGVNQPVIPTTAEPGPRVPDVP